MATARHRDLTSALLEAHGQTYAVEVGLGALRNGPSSLFRLLCAALLLGSRIGSSLAVRAAKALADQGWTTAEKLASATWEQRTKTLNEAGYARYDEQTSRYLGETAELLLERYHGDLRRLRAEAGRDPDHERRLLKDCKGVGDVTVDVFFREVQSVWGELYPFVDARALDGARALGLPADAGRLSDLVDRGEFTRLVAALVRVQLDSDADRVRDRAGS